MNRKDYKEIWQDFYDEAREAGETEDKAGETADAALADHYAAIADELRDRAKERGL